MSSQRILIIGHEGQITTVLGTASVVLPSANQICMQMYIKPATSSTTYDVKLTDVYERDVQVFTECVGLHNKYVTIPAYSNWILTIENASADEEFDYLLANRER